MNKLPLAIGYLQKGYSVIPVKPDKVPVMQWKEFQDKKATMDEVVGWFQFFPDAQVGIVTGSISNLTVIDVETAGDFNLIKDETYTVETGGKGRHYYFEYEPEFKNSVRLLPEIDVRGQGGYIVAAGSETNKGPYKVLKDIKVAKMSKETKTLLLEAANRQKSPSGSVGQYPRTTEGLSYDGAGEGSRNDSMTKYAGSIHAKMHPTLWSSVGYQLFESANSKNIPPLPERELQMIWNSIGNREERQNPGGRVFQLGQAKYQKMKEWGPEITPPKIEEKKLVTEEQVYGPNETLHIAEVASLQKIDTDKTYPINMPPIDDALLGGFSAGDLVVIAGQSGEGKTTVVQDWTTTLALGGVNKMKPLPTLWFSYEVLAKPLWDKFQKIGANLDTPIFMPCVMESGDLTWITNVIEEAIQMWNIKVVAIDHLGFLRPPKGNYANAADSITHTVRALKQLAVKYGLIIILPVHIRKTLSKVPDLNDIKDSLGIVQEADTVFFIGREKDVDGLPTNRSFLSLVKNRKSGLAVNIMLDFQFGRFYYDSSNQQRRHVEQKTSKPYHPYNAD